MVIVENCINCYFFLRLKINDQLSHGKCGLTGHGVNDYNSCEGFSMKKEYGEIRYSNDTNTYKNKN